MDIKVYPGVLNGVLQAPPSKSLAHRALICAALTDGESVIHGISGSKDMEATIGCVEALGAEARRAGSDLYMKGIFSGSHQTVPEVAEVPGQLGAPAASEVLAGSNRSEVSEVSVKPAESERLAALAEPDESEAVLNCIESGSTLRFMLPVAAALGARAEFVGRGKLPERPMTPLASEMKKKGVRFLPDGRDSLPFRIEGKLEAGIYTIPGNVSSQYISGLLFALPLLTEASEIRITGNLESASYIDLTLAALAHFGVHIEKAENGFLVPGGQRYRAREIAVEGDFSNAAFWLAAGAMGSDLTIRGLAENSAQGDRAAADILQSMGAGCDRTGEAVHAYAGPMRGRTVDCADIPDIVPILSVAAAAGETRFVNAGRLRIKESDRLAAMAEILTALGADVTEGEDSLTVRQSALQGGCEVDGHNDHRIVMSAAIAALQCREPVIIRGAEAVSKSYPDFFEVFRELGGRADVITDR